MKEESGVDARVKRPAHDRCIDAAKKEGEMAAFFQILVERKLNSTKQIQKKK